MTDMILTINPGSATIKPGVFALDQRKARALSRDARILAESDAESADEALEIFAFRVGRETAALTLMIGGIDALVFTGGIGEHQPDMRARICSSRLAGLHM